MGLRMKRNMELTPKQYEVYLFIVKYSKEHGYAPSFQEIADGTGIKSKSAVKRKLDELQRKGKIKYESNTSRAICLLEYTFVPKAIA